MAVHLEIAVVLNCKCLASIDVLLPLKVIEVRICHDAPYSTGGSL